jgi:CHU_C Type IX secretion signal domain
MESIDPKFIEVESYLNGTLDLDSRIVFEEKLLSNNELASQLELHKLGNEIILRQRLSKLEEISRSTAKEYQKNKLVKNFVWPTLIATAVIMTGFYFANPYFNTENQKAIITPKKASVIQQTTKPSFDKNTNNLESIKTSNTKQKHYKLDSVGIKTNKLVHNDVSEEESKPSISKDSHIVKNNVLSNVTKVTITPKPSIVVNASKGTLLTAQIDVTNTCINESEGQIRVTGIEGGTKPYAVKIFNQNTNEEYYTTGLAPGSYKVVLLDVNGCVAEYPNVTIGSYNCIKEEVFNPLLGEVWQVTSSSFDLHLFLYNTKGVEVFSAIIPAHTDFSWDGKQKNGEIESGVFVYLLKYSDGSQKQGSITILK